MRSAKRDMQLQLCARRRTLWRRIYKAHKWFVTRGDLDYTALWILYAANAAGADRGDRRAGCWRIAK